MTSIWFVQTIPGGEVRIVDFYQNCQKTLDHYVHILENKGYVYKDWWLPHDAENKNMTGKSVKDILQAMGKPVRITPKLSIADGINAARTLLGRCFIHEQNCSDGRTQRCFQTSPCMTSTAMPLTLSDMSLLDWKKVYRHGENLSTSNRNGWFKCI
jgi:hypothetical protein